MSQQQQMLVDLQQEQILTQIEWRSWVSPVEVAACCFVRAVSAYGSDVQAEPVQLLPFHRHLLILLFDRKGEKLSFQDTRRLQTFS